MWLPLTSPMVLTYASFPRMGRMLWHLESFMIIPVGKKEIHGVPPVEAKE